MSLKYCSKCGEFKDISEFYKNRCMPDGLCNWCKKCKSQASKKFYINNKERLDENHRKYKLEHPEYNKTYYQEHLEELKQYGIQYNIEHKEEHSLYHKKYYEEHKEIKNAYSRNRYNTQPESYKQYYRDHQEHYLELAKEYRIKNADKMKEKDAAYKKEHPEMVREISRRRRAHQAELPFNFYEEDEQFALEYWENKCAVCGRDLDLSPKPKGHAVWAFDHWIPMSDPRPNNPGTVPENMLPICHGVGSCNNSKSYKNPTEWLYKKFPDKADEILERINNYFTIFKEEQEQVLS